MSLDNFDFEVRRLNWAESLQYVLRTESFKDLYKKANFNDEYLPTLFGEEADNDWLIDEEVKNGKFPTKIKNEMSYVIEFCEKENVDLYEIVPTFEAGNWGPDPKYFFKEKTKDTKKAFDGHGLTLEGIKGSIENKL